MAKFDAHLKCSFCGKSQDQVRKLIAGPGVYICDECIDLCNEILDEELVDSCRPIPHRGSHCRDRCTHRRCRRQDRRSTCALDPAIYRRTSTSDGHRIWPSNAGHLNWEVQDTTRWIVLGPQHRERTAFCQPSVTIPPSPELSTTRSISPYSTASAGERK